MMLKHWKLILLGVLGFHLFLLVQLKFTAWPEMLLWPYMMIHGLLPYKDMAIAHTPHLLVDLAIIFKIFGTGVVQLKIYTWLLVIITDVLLFWVSNKLWNRKVAIVATFSYIILQIFFDGNGLWFDLMLAPFALLTYYQLQKKNYLWVGILWAVMFLTKQTAFWFLLPIGLQVLQNKKERITNIVQLVIGTAGVAVLFVLLLLLFGILPDFWNWAVNFGGFVLPRSQGQIQLPDLKNIIIVGFVFVVFVPFLLNKKTRNINLFVWAVAGMMGVFPRFEYFHFQPALSFVAIAIGTILVSLKRRRIFNIFIIFYLLGSFYLFANYFMRNWKEGTRFYETDVRNLVSYVKQNTNPGEKIFILNWWDNIYPLTSTLPATDPWVPQLSWYQDLSGVQEKEIEDLKTTKPRIILFKEYESTGLAGYKPQILSDYITANYEFKEKMDGVSILVLKK